MNERRKHVLQDLDSALARLAEALDSPKTDLNRDASIQRFEFTFELYWKALKIEAGAAGLRVSSPRDAIRAAFQLGYLEDDALPFTMLDDRNRTSHLYTQEMAQEVYARLPSYLLLIKATLARIRAADAGGPD